MNTEKDIDKLFKKIFIHAENNNLKEALELAESIKNKEIKNPNYLELKGVLLSKASKTKKAISTLKKTIIKNPNQYGAYIVLGEIYCSQGKVSKAKEIFNKAKKIDNNQCLAETHLCKIMLNKGQIEKGINKLTELCKTYSNNLEARMALGMAFIELGEYELAEKLYEAIIEKNETHDLAKLSLGICFLQKGAIGSAEKIIEKYAYYYQHTRQGMAAVGLLRYRQGKTEEAIHHLKAAIGQGSVPILWKSTLVEAMARQGNKKPAIKFYKKLIKIGNKFSIFRVAKLYEELGEKNKATKFYNRIGEKDINYLESVEGYCRCNRKKGNINKLKQALNLHKKDQRIRLLLITELLKKEKSKEALQVIDSGLDLELSPRAKQGLYLLKGLIFDDLIKYEKAQKSFKKGNNKIKYKKPNSLSVDDEKIIEKEKEEKRTDEAPVFIMGSNSVLIKQVINLLEKNNITILKDRLINDNRNDCFSQPTPIRETNTWGNDLLSMKRKKYYRKIRAIGSEISNIVEALPFNLQTVYAIQRVFPNATLIVLDREQEDIELHQKVFGDDSVDLKSWKKAKEQLERLSLQIEILNTDNNLINTIKLEKIFNKKISVKKASKPRFWELSHFPKRHWINYKGFLNN